MIRNSARVQSVVIPTWSPIPRSLFGDHVEGEDQLLDEGRIMPDWSMSSNSWRATLSRSGVRRRAREEIGGPVVRMWCVTECFTGYSAICGSVTDRNSHRRDTYSLSGSCGIVVRQMEVSEVMMP